MRFLPCAYGSAGIRTGELRRHRQMADGVTKAARSRHPPDCRMGRLFSGPQGLRDYLLSRPDEFVSATVARLLTYALGRELDARDQPTIRRIMREAEAGGYRFQDLIVAIVNSAPFQMRQAQAKPKDRS